MCAEDRWLADLCDQTIPWQVVLFGRTQVSSQWSVEDRVLSHEHLFYHVISGSMWAWLDERRLRLNAGDALWLPPGVRHRFTLADSDSMEVYHLRLRLDDASVDGLSPLRVQRCHHNEANWAALYREYRLAQTHWDMAFRAGLTQALVGILRQRAAADDGLSPDRLAAMDRYLDRTPPGEWQPRPLAEHLGLSLEHFGRLFKNTWGERPRSWLARERIRRASADLATSSATIADIAAQWGYEDPFLFSRQFKKVMGRSPREWRSLDW